MDILGFIGRIVYPIQWVLAWIMNLWHMLMSFLGMPPNAGIAWVLGIVLMTLTIKTCLIPLLIKQIHATRRMQGIQPQLQAIQKKYKGKKDQQSRMAMNQETMALYKQHKANPMSSCVPMLFQGPILFSLYWMLRDVSLIAAGQMAPLGPIDKQAAMNIENTQVFGAKLSSTVLTTDLYGQITIWITVALMSIAMFISQNLNTRVNVSTATKESPMYRSQKIMAMVFPLMYIFMGMNIQMGVLVYWVISNCWMLGQTIFQITYAPTPGSQAEDWAFDRAIIKKSKTGENLTKGEYQYFRSLRDKENSKSKEKLAKIDILPPEVEVGEVKQRQQPKSNKRSKKK